MTLSRQITQILTLCGAWLVFASAQAATISGPSTSTSGDFTLTWPSGYELRLQDASWRYAASPTRSHVFANFPSGDYRFKLVQCVYVPPPYGPGWSCYDDAASFKTITVTRDAEPAIDTSTGAACHYRLNTPQKGGNFDRY